MAATGSCWQLCCLGLMLAWAAQATPILPQRDFSEINTAPKLPNAGDVSVCDGAPYLNSTKGDICGMALPSGARLFLGIPYAAPPTGSLRFKSPAPAVPWSQPLQATKYGPGCIQLHHNPDVPPEQSEDCLTLNVYAPAPGTCGSEEGRLPAMLWFHGGSFEEGGSSLFYYNATQLALRQCVVVVTGNYRLGSFGSMFLPQANMPGNQHLRDQRAMMQWMHDNADHLGIDADRITLFGQSAGAMSIQFHLTSPNSTALFNQAILESPAALVYKTRHQAAEYADLFAQQLGCQDVSEGPELASCMQSKNTSEVAGAWKSIGENRKDIAKIVLEWESLAVFLTFSPAVLEDAEWPIDPETAAAKGMINKPLMVGSNDADAALFVACGKNPLHKLEYEAGLSVAFGTHVFKVNHLYKAPGHGEDCSVTLSNVFTDFLFRCPLRRWADGVSTTSIESDTSATLQIEQANTPPVFVYRFNHSLAFNVFNKSCCDNKPCHATEVPLVFDASGPYEFSESTTRMSEIMMNMWGSFARSGDPNSAKTSEIEWPKFDASGSRQGVIFQQDEVQTYDGSGDSCDSLWDTWKPFWYQPGAQ